MTESKTFDIVYPDAVAGVITAETAMDAKSLKQMVVDAVGTMEATPTVRPVDIEYGYLPVTRD